MCAKRTQSFSPLSMDPQIFLFDRCLCCHMLHPILHTCNTSMTICVYHFPYSFMWDHKQNQGMCIRCIVQYILLLYKTNILQHLSRSLPLRPTTATASFAVPLLVLSNCIALLLMDLLLGPSCSYLRLLLAPLLCLQPRYLWWQYPCLRYRCPHCCSLHVTILVARYQQPCYMEQRYWRFQYQQRLYQLPRYKLLCYPHLFISSHSPVAGGWTIGSWSVLGCIIHPKVLPVASVPSGSLSVAALLKPAFSIAAASLAPELCYNTIIAVFEEHTLRRLTLFLLLYKTTPTEARKIMTGFSI